MWNTKFKSFEKGVSLTLAIIILSVLLAMALGVSTILVNQTRTLRGMENSLQAFFAADTGIEQALDDEASVFPPVVLANGAEYEVTLLPAGSEGCEEEEEEEAVAYCLQSIGSFRGSRRAIEIIR